MNEMPGKTAPQDPAVARLVTGAGALGAWRYADEAHAGQTRKSNLAPYIHHPEKVAMLIGAHGADDAMIAAALLHDVLEDTPTRPEQISERFGEEVACLVCSLSDDRSIDDYLERKTALREQVREAGERAALTYVADKLANTLDLREAYAEIGEGVVERLPVTLEQRIQIWRDDGTMCGELLGASHELVTRLAAELDGLEHDRATLAIG